MAATGPVAGCGGSSEPVSTPTVRTESPALPTPSATATVPPTATTPPTATAPSAPAPPEDAQGGAGDETAARTRVSVVVDGEGITPPRLEVPAFLALRVAVRNDLPQAITVTVPDGNGSARIPARSRRAVDADGLRPGDHPLDAGVAGRATLVAVRP